MSTTKVPNMSLQLQLWGVEPGAGFGTDVPCRVWWSCRITWEIHPKLCSRLDTPELELEAHIWWFRSTHGYYKTTKYQLSSSTLTLLTRNRIFQDFALLLKILHLRRTFKSPFWIFGAACPLQRALTLRFRGVRQQTWYLGTPTSSILSIFEVFRIPRFFWKIFFRGWKKIALFSKNVHHLGFNYMELISDQDFSQSRKYFLKRLKLSHVIRLKLIWFKYELRTRPESEVRAVDSVRIHFVQGVATRWQR